MSLPKNNLLNFYGTDVSKTPFVLFQAHPDDYKNMSEESLRGLQTETILSKLFFHPKNVETIQKTIISEVFRRTNGEYLIEKQDEADLQVIMRSMFLQHARHVPDNITAQIRELNFIVVDDTVPGIITQVRQYMGYLDKLFSPRNIIDLPEYVSSKGMKSIPSVTSVWGRQKN